MSVKFWIIHKFSHLVSQSAAPNFWILQYSVLEYFTLSQDFQTNITDL